MTKVEIREFIPATYEDDLNILVPAYLTIWNHPGNLEYLSFTGQPFTEEQVLRFCREHLKKGVRYFGACAPNGEVIGIIITRADPIEGFEFLGLGVAPHEKGKGVGLKLVRHGVKVALNGGYMAADGQVFATNAPMLRLLLGEGFLPVRMEYHRGPQGEDLVFLKKYLHPESQDRQV